MPYYYKNNEELESSLKAIKPKNIFESKEAWGKRESIDKVSYESEGKKTKKTNSYLKDMEMNINQEDDTFVKDSKINRDLQVNDYFQNNIEK